MGILKKLPKWAWAIPAGLVVLVALFVGNSELFKGSLSGASWYQCANENGRCVFSGTKTVLYGAGDKFASRTVTDGTTCSNAVFGDPIYGVAKKCYYSSGIVSDTETYWNYCADENGICSFPGIREVTYGAKNSFKTKIVNGKTQCVNSAFGGDPIYGVAKKCYYSNRVVSLDLSVGDVVTTGTDPYYRVNLTGGKLANTFKIRVTYRVGKISNPGTKGGDIIKTNSAWLGITPGSYAQFNFDKSLFADSYYVTIDVDFENAIAETNETNNTKLVNLPAAPVSTPTLARCQTLKLWFEQGTFTQNGGGYNEVASCTEQFGPISISAQRCNSLKMWRDNNVLTLYSYSSKEFTACENYWPTIWNSPKVTLDRCRQLNNWAAQGVLTPNIGGSSSGYREVQACNDAFGVIVVSESRCQQIKNWSNQNLLSIYGIGVDQVFSCGYYHPDIWWPKN